jgi:hypothetical protein
LYNTTATHKQINRQLDPERHEIFANNKTKILKRRSIYVFQYIHWRTYLIRAITNNPPIMPNVRAGRGLFLSVSKIRRKYEREREKSVVNYCWSKLINL